MKTYEQYIQQVLKDIERRKTVDYGDKNSVRRYNAAYDRIADHVTAIENLYPDRINDFFQMIYHNDVEIAHTCACFVINRNSFSKNQKKEAVILLENSLNRGMIAGLEAVSLEFVLPKWKQSLGM